MSTPFGSFEDPSRPAGRALPRRALLVTGGSMAAVAGLAGAAWSVRGARHPVRRPSPSVVSLVAVLVPATASVAAGPTREDDVGAVAFSPDGRTLAAGHRSGTVRLWDVARRRQVRALRGGRRIVCVAFGPDGGTLACGSGGSAHLWDLASGRRSDLPGGGWVAFRPDGRLVAVAGGGGEVWLWRMPERRRVATLRVAGRTDFVVFSPDGRTLACGGGEMGRLSTQLWEVAGRSCRSTFVIPRGRDGWPDRVVGLSFDPVGRPLALDDGGGVWDIAAGRRAATLRVGGVLDGLSPGGISPDARTAVGVTGRVVRFLDVPTGRLLDLLDRPSSFSGWQIAFTRDSGLVAVASGPRVLLYRLRRGA